MSHAKFPPSMADRWLRCGRTVKLSPMYPDKRTAASEEGTRQHDIAAKHLTLGSDSKDPKMQGYLDEVRGRAEGGTLRVEEKVTIVEGLCWGTSDATILHPDTIIGLTVIDLKWGRSPVTALGNPQLMLYALGALELHPLSPEQLVDLCIYQPNAASGPPLRHSQVEVKALHDFRDRKVDPAIERGLQEDPPAEAGRWCFWCPAKLHCPEYLRYSAKKKEA